MSLQQTLTPETMLVPSRRFTTDGFRKEDQFDGWCSFTAAMSDLEPVKPARDGFLARAEAHDMGSMMLTSFDLSPMKFKYTKDDVRKAKFDHWYMAVITKGSVSAANNDNAVKAAVGSTVLHSYATPFSGLMGDAGYSCIFFSRDEFWDIAGELDGATHRSLDTPMAQVIADFIVSLKNRASGLTVAEGAAVKEAFGALLRAMVRQTPDTMNAAMLPIAAAQFHRARRYINENLRSPKLTPEAVGANLGVSRRQLYYLFKQHGGVANFIRNRRLAACFEALKNDNEKRLISSIAYDYGFTNIPSFGRQFQTRYGFKPSDARTAWLSGQAGSAREGGSFVDWLMRADGA